MAKKYMKNLMLVIMELSIFIPMEVQANDYVPDFLYRTSLPIHHFHPSQLDTLNGHSSLFRCIMRAIESCHRRPNSEYLDCIELKFVACVDEASRFDPIYKYVKHWIKKCTKKLHAGEIDHVATCLKEFVEEIVL
jgi:hypothetical protein